MGRPSYVCATCSEHFTRKYSAKRHNQNIHNGAAEIVRLIDYLAGRSSGQYMPDNPFWYKHNNPYHNFGGTVADSVGNTFQPRYLPQQTPQGTSQYHTSPIHRSLPTMDDQSYETGLSPETKRKIDDLTRLMDKYPQFHNNPNGIIRWAINGAVKGDNKFLDEKLKQLLTIDSLAKFYVGPS
jgi:hypothetical protein